jgi:hypothetical protein
LNLQKAFENRQDRLRHTFKSGWQYAARFSKENCLIGKIFGGFQNCQIGSGRLSKALSTASRNLISNRSKGFELAAFEKLLENSVVFHTKGLRIY